MRDRNENKRGYKKTKAGWIPKEWSCGSLADIAQRPLKYGAPIASGSHLAGSLRYIRITDITEDGRLREGDKAWIEPSIDDEFVLRPGDIVLARSGATVGKTYLHCQTGDACAFAGYLIRFRANQHIVLPEYVFALTRTHYYSLWVLSTMHAGAQPNINAEEYGTLPVPIPSLAEQHGIVRILSTWDQAIDQTRRLIEAMKQRKKSLMQQLLTGKKRLKGFSAKWPQVRLSQIAQRITASPTSPEGYTVLSITAGTGFVSQEEKFSKVIAGRHIEHYVLLKRGEFSYNKGNSYRYPQGCAYRLHEFMNMKQVSCRMSFIRFV